MPAEVTRFKENLREALMGIAGMDAELGSRIYTGWPVEPVDMPCATIFMGREPYGTVDYPFFGWRCEVVLSLYDPSAEKLDTIEDLISNWVAGTNVPDALSSADEVRVLRFDLQSVGADEPTASLEDDRMMFLTRRLVYEAVIVAQGAYHP